MEEKKLTYEQLENVAKQLQNRVIQLESRLNNINMGQMRLDYLFKVLDRKEVFRPEFIEQCTLDIEEMFKIESEEESKEDSKEENTKE